MYSIDVIIEKKDKWTFKNMLMEKQIKYLEWFVEFSSENAIISFDVENREYFGDIFDFLKEKFPNSRMVFKNGNSIKPSKKSAEEIYCEFVSKIEKKEW